MKKFFVVLAIIVSVWGIMTISDLYDPAKKEQETYGTIWYGRSYGNVRVKQKETNKYYISVCWTDEEGNIDSFEELGPYEKEYVTSGVKRGIRILESK